MSPLLELLLAVVIGMAMGLSMALRRYGGCITFIFSTTSFVLVLLSFRFRFIGFLASGGGIAILLLILGMYVGLSMWAHLLAKAVDG